MLRIQAVAKSAEELRKITNPNDASQPESIPWVYYDTQDFATASTNSVSFFAVTSADRTISNLEQAGTIPDPFYFEIEAFNLDFFNKPVANAANTAVGALDDLAEFLYTARATLEFSIAGKIYLRLPATYLHASGGPQAVMTGTMTAPNLVSFALNGIVDGGFYVGKKIVLPPKQSFSVQIVLGAAPTFNVTPRRFRLNMAGVLHRRVL